MQESPLEERLMRRAESQFAATCKQLEIGARLNASAISAACDAFNHSDTEEQHFAPQAVAYGYTQLVHLHRALVLLAIDYEFLSAGSAALAE
jgi:hypothetical protein